MAPGSSKSFLELLICTIESYLILPPVVHRRRSDITYEALSLLVAVP
jgi:hypothetical protein